MFNDDEDFGFLTGGLGDLDGNGDVDFAEYMSEEDDFQRIMNSNKDDDFSVSDDDDDWEISYMDTATEYGLSPYDYADKEEFLEALAEAQGNNDDNAANLSNGFYSDSTDYDEDEEDDDEEEDGDVEDEDDEEYEDDGEHDDTDGDTIPFADFDISKLTLTIGANTSLDYDGKPIDQVFGNHQPTTKQISINKKNTESQKETPEKEYKKLKNENKALKSKITKLEKAITDLNYNIQRLEADLAAKRKVKEWDGKYYRYCKVTLDESTNGLWYRTDDITLKQGDYVYVPFGYQNEERMAKVMAVEEFRSDDLPFPLERTKFISYKCDE